MDSEELTSRVRALRARGSTPKAIARALGVPPATVAPLVRAIAAEDYASAPERELIQCWVSPGWSQGLTVDGHRDWPDVDTPDTGASGLVSVLVTRQARHGKVRVCGWLVDVWCLGVKDTVGPRSMDQRRAAEFTGSYFAAYQARPLAAPLDLAQHLVFGAVAYARRLGFEPAPGFDQPPVTSAHGPVPARSASDATASPCSSKAPMTTPRASSTPWSVPSGRTTSTTSSPHSRGRHLPQHYTRQMLTLRAQTPKHE
jgi:hypothetical protein